jgi:RNA polymerase sigma-70 factor, ECF subfamily
MFSESDVIKGLRDGDESVFKFVFDEYYRPLTLFAFKYLHDIECSKEVVQEFFVRLWLKRETLSITFSLKMYLYQSVRNACFNYIESNKVAQRRLQSYKPSDYSSSNALDDLLAAEQEELLMQAVDRLPEKCREVFLLSRMEKLPNKAIADRLQISVKTVETQISIALKRLRDLLLSLLVALMSW